MTGRGLRQPNRKDGSPDRVGRAGLTTGAFYFYYYFYFAWCRTAPGCDAPLPEGLA